VNTTRTREHGERAKYVIERCRCGECREAVRLYELKRRRALSRPDEAWVPYVPAGKARRYLKELSEYGIGHKTVAKVSGVPHGTISKLIYGDPARRMGPSKRIRPETERRLLAVTLEDAAGAAKIPAGSTWKLLDDLIARGFTKTWIAGQLGAESPALQLSRVRVRATTARKVAELHRRLQGVEAPPRRTRWSS
jgi:hypothetical protein